MLKRLSLIIYSLALISCQPVEKNSTLSALQVINGKSVSRDYELKFPRDHGIHADQGIEWWYLTANLQSDTGEKFGVQWTLFRTLMPSKIESTWWDNNLYFAHFALQNKQNHVSFERFARVKQATISASPFVASIDDWALQSVTNDFLPLSLKASQDDYDISITLSKSPIILHGDNGFSRKTQSGHASYYFSYPFLNVDGNLTFAGKSYKVSGNAWYDREWSSRFIDKQQLGWDWFSLVDSQSQKVGLMLFCIRGKDQNYDYCSGTRISSDGQATSIEKEDIKLSVLEVVTLEHKKYPSRWKVIISGSNNIIIETVTKDSRNQLTIPYWEGRIKSSGGFSGEGYAELTGY